MRNTSFLFLLLSGMFLYVSDTALAATTTSVQSFVLDLIAFLNNVLVPFLFSIALVAFIANVIRYFIIDNDLYDKKKSAKQYALYSIIAFVLLVSIWGIVNLLVSGFGFNRERAVCPDSVPASECYPLGGGIDEDLVTW